MPNANPSFQGATLVIPGVYSYINTSGTNPTNQPTTPPLVFIGFGYGVQPQTPTNFVSTNSLTQALRGGPCATYVPFFSNPSTEVAGATNVTYINVGENTQASYTLLSGTGSGVITLTTVNYGSPSNLMQVEVQNGTVGGIDLTLYDGYSNSSAEGLNLGIPFQLAYTNSTNPATSVTFSVDYALNPVTGLNEPSTFVVSSTNSGESFTVPIGETGYTTVSALVQYINGSGLPYIAQVISDGSLPTTNLDEVSDVTLPPPTSSGDQFVNVTAILGDVVYWVNQYANTLCTAEIISGVVSTPSTTIQTIPLTHFSGGKSIPPLTSDYANAFNVALTTPAWVVFADSNSSAVLALGAAHAETASTIAERKWRRFVSGSSVGDTITTAQKTAQGLNSQWVSYCYPGVTAIDTNTGLNTTYGGIYLAAMVAGIMCGNPINLPLTHKTLNATGLEFIPTTSQINSLQQSGIITAYIGSTGIPTLASDMTTWQNDNNPSHLFNQQVACQAALQYGLVSVLNQYIGQVNGGPVSLQLVKKAIQNFLASVQYTTIGSSGYISSYDASNIVVSFDNATQALTATVPVVFVGQIRFVLVNVTVSPL